MNRLTAFTEANWREVLFSAFCIAVMLLTFGCTRGVPPRRTLATDENARLVRYTRTYTNEPAWQRSGYWRMEDQPGSWPWLLVVASDGTGCPAFSQVLEEPRPNDYYSCPGRWRTWRRP